jgi:hypothetical protein
MTAPDGSHFHVIASQEVLHNLENLYNQAKQKGWDNDFLAALKRIDSNLRQRPNQFGEPRFTLRHLDLEIRVAIDSPLVVAFGVHRQKPIVFVREVSLLPGPD